MVSQVSGNKSYPKASLCIPWVCVLRRSSTKRRLEVIAESEMLGIQGLSVHMRIVGKTKEQVAMRLGGIGIDL
jgi:hypothetical protein